MDREQETVLVLAGQVIRFATNHPYAATGIFGAAVGSAVTYKVLTHVPRRPGMNGVFTPKVYEFALTPEDLRRMMVDPSAEIRWETTDMVVIVTPEKRERPKELPDIVIE